MADPFGIYYDAQTGGYIDPRTGEHLSGGKLDQLRYLKRFTDQANNANLAGGAGQAGGGGVMTQDDFGPFQANPFGAGGGGGGGGNDAQRAFMAQRGIQGGLDEAAMKATERLLGNPGMHFGQGGGDWARAWTQAQQPLQSNFMKMYGGIDTDLFNSPSGPYGQFQQAAAYTAPARSQRYVADVNANADRYIADRKYDTIGQLFGQLSDRLAGPSVANVESDYGAFAKVMPTIMQKYMPTKR